MNTPLKPSKGSTFSHLDPGLRGRHLKFEGRVTALALAAGFPGVALCALLLWLDGYSGRVQWTVDLLLVFFWLAISANLKHRVIRPLQTLSNILAAIREGLHRGRYDYPDEFAKVRSLAGEMLASTRRLVSRRTRSTS